MNSTAPVATSTSTLTAVAAEALYRAELALHDAHATGVDTWITAAAERLHEAVVQYTSLIAA